MLKELREKKARLEAEAKAKLASITADTTAEQQRAIEQEHAALLTQIAEVAQELARAEKSQKLKAKSRKNKAANKDDDSDEDADDDDGDSDDDGDPDDDGDGESDSDRRKRKKRKARSGDDADDGADRAASALTRSAMAEMVLIDSQARAIGVDLGNLSDAITRNETPDVMRKRLFDELAKRSKQAGPKGGVIEFGRDENDGRAASMEIALISRTLNARGGRGAIEYKPKNPAELELVEAHRAQSQQYMGMGFVEIAAECIGYRGNIRTPHKAYEILSRAFESTSDFPNIFQNVLNKSLLARYELATPTYRQLAIERPFNDFRPHPQVRAGEFPQLQPVTETGEIKYGSSADTGENVSVSPYGVIFTISRTMLVNDDLGGIDQILGSAGDAVIVFENTTFFAMFNSNPVLNQDSTAVFASGHNNLAGSGAVPSVTTIGAGRQALRGMKSISGLFLNVPPSIILTGPDQETAADQMVTAITPTLTTSVNPFSGRLRSVSDANITDTSWYIATDPARVPCFVFGFLNGSSGPRVRTFEPFGVQGVKVSLEHDFGCGAIDYRGFYKNPGA